MRCERGRKAEHRGKGEDVPKMGRAQRIIDLVTGDPRLKSSSAFSEKVYRDEPILMTASQMRRFLPQQYRDMRAIASSPAARYRPAAWVFVQQARFMEDFEDDYRFDGEFVCYYPTYQSMSDEQLRGYFSWRTRLRRGDIPPAPTSFAFVYIYELLNGIGPATAEDGFRTLKAFMETYGKEDDAVRRHLKRWLVDYAVWHGLDAGMLDGLVESGTEEAIGILEGASDMDVSGMSFHREPSAPSAAGPGRERTDRFSGDRAEARADECAAEDGGDACGRAPLAFRRSPTRWDELYDAIVALSTYRIESSRLFKEHPNEFRRALCGVCAVLAAYCAKHRKTSFAKGLFGTFRIREYEMFKSAVFYDGGRHPDATYRMPDGRVLFCRHGRWMLKKRGTPGRGPKLGAIAKAVDARLREELEDCGSLKCAPLPKYMERIVREVSSAAVKWEREHAPLKLSFDARRISGIRAAASQTCEALLVDEEREAVDRRGGRSAGLESLAPKSGGGAAARCGDSPFREESTEGREGSPAVVEEPSFAGERPFAGEGPAHAASGSSAQAGPASPLDDGQREWLAALLAGDACRAARAVRERGLTDDLMADAVNEALFDFLGDTAVESSADWYAIVEDYREDVEGLIQ